MPPSTTFGPLWNGAFAPTEMSALAGLAAAAAPVFLAMSLLPECRRWSERALLALDDTTRGGSEEMHLQAAFGISSMYTMGNDVQSYNALTKGLELRRNYTIRSTSFASSVN